MFSRGVPLTLARWASLTAFNPRNICYSVKWSKSFSSSHSVGNYYFHSHHSRCLPHLSCSGHASDTPAPPLPRSPSYPEPPFPSRLGLSPYSSSPPYTHPPHNHLPGPRGFAPLYDSRRLWRPQLHHRQDGRSNSLPLEVLHSSICHSPLRERFNSLDSTHCGAADRRAPLHQVQTGEVMGRIKLGVDATTSVINIQ